jgi:hypothetical protein
VPPKSPARLLALILLLATAGCSSDAIYGPQKFFPGGNRHSWSDCGKFASGGPDVQICAGMSYLPGGIDLTPQSYVISYNIASDQHVLLAVFDARGALVRTLLDEDQSAVPLGVWLTVEWRFTDDAGQRVPSGDYRAYFRAGDFVSSSDVEVP